MSLLNPLNAAKAAINYIAGKKEEKKETRDNFDFFSDGDDIITGYDQTQQINTQLKKEPLNEKITQQETEEETTTETEEETPTETQTETQTETPTETEEKKIIPKKQETKIINKIADSVESFIKHDKPLIDTINDLRECLTILPEDRKYEIVEYVARELANATDAEGNKLFKDETEAKQFLHTISTKTPNIRYKLPIEIQKEIKEKTPKILTSLTQRNIRSVGAANKNIYQY